MTDAKIHKTYIHVRLTDDRSVVFEAGGGILTYICQISTEIVLDTGDVGSEIHRPLVQLNLPLSETGLRRQVVQL